MRSHWDQEKIKQANQSLSKAHPIEIIRWGNEVTERQRLTLACSFGYEDVALVGMVQQVDPSIPIFYLDTSLLFKEVEEVQQRLSDKYQIKFHRVTTLLTLNQQAKQYGEKLWASDPNLCCQLRKVEPLRQHLEPYEGWITGVRRQQSTTRSQTDVVEWDESFQLLKLNPLTYWTDDQVWAYIRQHDIPYNPLHDQGYPSIGCWPCTRKVKPGEDPRSGRWSGFNKTECGLHTSSSNPDEEVGT
ncbi:phosphoadenylylsulfate reductase (thioredoxin) [Seinonella peptonophila]|uniref:Adenosine 5'-phosphosulfate reductase n=1 Tax=Seinonella peptonophila TaxID=112248 RepID=A0A1M4W5Q6_9BACL|nr:phosphoadenylyl-sulfate reductase [Seinonella peptonophila]SHE76485.1 phosphoadenylylsulfate reductase (thioredoxin) [Seinonella peptonophila]